VSGPFRSAGGGTEIDRSTRVAFTWNGKKFNGYEGDTIVSALAANGVDVFSRSMKYHRRRGVLSGDYWDPNCMVQVGDEPNVRGAHRLVEAGMAVSAQNVWPSLERDVKAINGVVGRFLTAGFYYKTFMKPAWLWPTYERVLATFAPGGRIDTESTPGDYDVRFAHPDVVVVGGGPAGMAAAIAAADSGADTMLVEHEHHLGGHLRWGTDPDRAVAADLIARVDAAGVEVLTNATATGWYESGWLSINERQPSGADGPIERLIKCRARCTVVAPGLIERPYVFDGNDRVGVMLSTAVRRMLHLYGVVPGERAVVVSANPEGDQTAADLIAAGVDVTVVDARCGTTVAAAEGHKDPLQRVVLSNGRVIDADLLVTAVGWTAPTSLVNMAGDRPAYDETAARFFPTPELENRSHGQMLVAGGLAGDGTIEQLTEHASHVGRLAARRGLTARAQMRAATPRADHGAPVEVGAALDAASMPAPLGRNAHPALFRSTTHGLVDYSEDISSKDIVAAAKEGFDSVELAKRFTTATMGPSQGKLETVNTVAVLAEHHGQTLGQVGTTVWRPPYAPISLGALAGFNLTPHRESSIQHWHDQHGAEPLHAGAWVRPEHYGDAQAEARNVRTNVGIIDVSPLGKLDLRGANVADLLDLVYVNKWQKLPIGAVRYGVMVGEDGIVMDDGVTARLADDHYIMTTTSSGAASVWEWIENWLQTARPDWDVTVTPVTTAYTSINVAGPKSRELLARLTATDLTESGFAYMNVRTGTVAGVADCVMWRIGFTGELSYEVHVPAGYGLHVWNALLAAGADLGVAPFGIEAQRILRLEKGHFIVGQDTDGLTRAASAGLGALVKHDKADMVAKPELAWASERTDLPVLVRVLTDDPAVIAEEASQILGPDGADGVPVILGRITSSRHSPTLGRSICLAQVDSSVARAGTALSILLASGEKATATVYSDHAFVDPDGGRMRTDEATSGAQYARGRAAAHGHPTPEFVSPCRIHSTAGDVVITDVTATTKLVVRAPRLGATAEAIGVNFGRSRREDAVLVTGSRPGEWTFIGPMASGSADVKQLADGLVGADGHVIDLTHGRAMLRISGPGAKRLLARICNLDLADDFTPDGACVGATVAGVMCDLVRDDVGSAPSYLISFDRSFGQWMADTLMSIAGRTA
jgi:sarcosine oxidase, subunit alpha